MNTEKPKKEIIIASDGTGRTAQTALAAALTQFEASKPNIRLHNYIRDEAQLMDLIDEAKDIEAPIIHTIVSAKMRSKLLELGRLHNVEVLDLMGPLLAQLTIHFNSNPSEQPGLFSQINKSYFQRIEAMEFAFKHDDGQRTHELNKAEIILLGVSRTFKTPLSIYFAFKGWMAANVPIILDVPPPEILSRLPAEKIFALTTVSNRLSMLRKARHEYLGGATGSYADPDHVKKELLYASRYYHQHPQWPIIDVTNKPIEEIANEIIAIIRKRKKI